MSDIKKPELLAPAGSPEALYAAVSAGADAVYLGLSKFNARVNASNFGRDELKEAVSLCRLHGKKIYITLNTLTFDRELDEVISEAYFCASEGVDAFIVQDLGLMRSLFETLPEVELHASTQCATHNLEQIKALAELGVTRAVVARELSKGDLEAIMKETPVEIEAFVHGALCMSHSGTCLMSAYMGGRSGNRGACAQPCRLPYKTKDGRESYPLSLSDLSLCTHVKELCGMGIDSFKIEGRMKSAEYVYGVVSVWRKLIDERRDATPEEIKTLENIFSRGGFTDGYYTLKKGSAMFGTRSEEDKEKTRNAEKSTKYSIEKIPVSARFEKRGGEAVLTLETRGVSVHSSCEALDAEGEGTGKNVISESLLKLGDTPFSCKGVEILLDSPAFFKRSVLNELRRNACERLQTALVGSTLQIPKRNLNRPNIKNLENLGLWVVFSQGRQVFEKEALSLVGKAERVFLPFYSDFACPSDEFGIVLPRAVFEKDREEFEKRLDRLFALGYKCAFAENLGVGLMAKKKGFRLFGGAGLNLVNSYTARVLEEFGFEAAALSGEVTDKAKMILCSMMPLGDTAWGRAPLMLVENCIMGVRDNCIGCDTRVCRKKGSLVDRTGETFPVMPEPYHRAVIYNSRPTYRADIEQLLSFRVIYITDEPDVLSVIRTVKEGKPLNIKFTRK